MLFPFLSRLFAPMLASRKAGAEERRVRRHRRPSPKPPRARLAVEALEDRSLPAANFGWAAAFGSGAQATTIATDSANNVIVGGFLYGSPATFGSGASAVTLTPVNQNQGFLAKYTPTGDLLWAELANLGRNGAVDNAGNYIQAEQNASTLHPTLTKYDPNGNTLWTLDLSQSGIANSGGGGVQRVALLDSLGDVYVSGWFKGTYDFDPSPGTYDLTSSGSSSGFVLKLTQ
ncbi:MAG: hypothetical protein HYS12_21925 [Planctomycetes bacterium]|nr:hypothetical protein [Planctomycetota bacterium]